MLVSPSFFHPGCRPVVISGEISFVTIVILLSSRPPASFSSLFLHPFFIPFFLSFFRSVSSTSQDECFSVVSQNGNFLTSRPEQASRYSCNFAIVSCGWEAKLQHKRAADSYVSSSGGGNSRLARINYRSIPKLLSPPGAVTACL